MLSVVGDEPHHSPEKTMEIWGAFDLENATFTGRWSSFEACQAYCDDQNAAMDSGELGFVAMKRTTNK